MINSSDILNGKLLIVDDQEANIILLERMLRGAGYVAITSTMDPRAVRDLHLRNAYDLILLDIQMPGMDGFQVMDSLKQIETSGYLPVLVITAQPDQKLRALSAGAKDFISKPFELPEVLIRVRNMLEVRLLHQEAVKAKNLEGENRRIMQGSRLKSEFLANMSHELRTPLNGIIGFSEILHDGKVGKIDAQQKEYLGDILNSSKHLLQLINDVLDLAKVESGKMEFHYETVSLQKVIGEVRDVLRTLTAQKRISFEASVHPKVSRVVGDSSKLKQILYNYLSNALKFTPMDGRVRVRALPQGPDHFRIEVEDSGVGIKAEDHARLFVEFQQLDSTMAKKHGGTGLGLALTKRIVEAQGGQIGLQSAPGQGSVFFAILPKTQPIAIEPSVPDRSSARPGQTATVLVVDDNNADRVWLINKLAAAGYAVEAVSNGEEAISRCKERRFGAVLLDLILQDMTGWEVVNAIRGSELNRETPVIVVTVVADKNAGIIHAIQDYLVKPVSLGVLKGALERTGILPAGSPRPVLVVDDDAKARKIMHEHLTGLGYRTILAGSGTEALEAAKKENPAAVILDLIMPEMDGFEFLKKFREKSERSQTPVIIWTGKDLSREETARLKMTTQALLRKEGASQELIDHLRAILPPSSAYAH